MLTIQKRSFNDIIYVSSLFVIIFPGMVKMLIGFGSSAVNIIAFSIFIFSFSFKTSLIVKSHSEFYFSYFCFSLLLLITIYIQLNSDQIDFMSFQYYIKACIYLIVAVLVFYSIERNQTIDFLKLILLVAVLIIARDIVFPIDYEDTNSNYLTYSFLLGASIVIIFYRILFSDTVSLFQKGIEFLFLLLFLVMNLFTGSRGSLLFAFLIFFIFLAKKMINISIFKKIALVIGLIVIVFLITFLISEYVTLNSWLLHKSERLISGDFESEPRYEIYRNSALFYYNNFNPFGLGFNPSRYISVSWDESLPFLESFPWELIFNFGVFGIAICLYILFFITIFIRLGTIHYHVTNQIFYIFLFVFFNFSKGWSVYSGFILFPLMAMTLATYRNEMKH